MKKILLIALLMIVSCSSCSKKKDSIKLTQDFPDFQIFDADENPIPTTDEEKYFIKINVTKKTIHI